MFVSKILVVVEVFAETGILDIFLLVDFCEYLNTGATSLKLFEQITAYSAEVSDILLPLCEQFKF